MINLIIRILGAFVNRWTGDGFKPFYPPLCLICHKPWQVIEDDRVVCPEGHRLYRPNDDDRAPLPNAGDYHGDI